jgi:hypothetical protein
MQTQCSQEELDFGSCGGRKLVARLAAWRALRGVLGLVPRPAAEMASIQASPGASPGAISPVGGGGCSGRIR